MSLLDLPPELFLHITHDIIDTCGVSGAWKLRGVCRTFADNITHEIMNRPTTTFSKHWRDKRFFEKIVSRYLAARIHNELDVDSNLIRKVQEMIAWAVGQLGNITTLQQRDDVAFKVCAALEQAVGTWELAHALDCKADNCHQGWIAWSQQPLNHHEKTLLIAAVGCYDNAAELLTAFCDSLSRSSPNQSWLNIVPFEFAFKTNDEVLLNVLLQYLADQGTPSVGGKATLSRLTSVRGSPFRTHYAVLSAIKYSNLDGLRTLLDFYRKHLSPPERGEYISWVGESMRGKDRIKAMQCLSLLLNYKPRGKSLVDKHIINTACDYGTAAMVKEVLKHANKDINAGTILTLPIFIAVRSGRTAAIDGVIDAGANPKVVADSNMRSVKKKRLTPVEVAMHRNCPDVVEALLQRGGGPIPHISEWTTHQRTYNFLRRKVAEESKIWVPKLRDFKWLTEDQRKAIKH